MENITEWHKITWIPQVDKTEQVLCHQYNFL